ISTVAKHAKNSSTLAAYTRHSDPRTTESYLDDREDSALELATVAFERCSLALSRSLSWRLRRSPSVEPVRRSVPSQALSSRLWRSR
ncbi:MAG: hypothetical protein ACYTFV_18125, partial [Planctomycetota bacterium]